MVGVGAAGIARMLCGARALCLLGRRRTDCLPVSSRRTVSRLSGRWRGGQVSAHASRMSPVFRWVWMVQLPFSDLAGCGFGRPSIHDHWAAMRCTLSDCLDANTAPRSHGIMSGLDGREASARSAAQCLGAHELCGGNIRVHEQPRSPSCCVVVWRETRQLVAI